MAKTFRSSATATMGAGTALAALLLGAAAMGISPVFVRQSEVGPFASAFWRVAGALPLLFAWSLAETGWRGAFSLRVAAKPVILGGLFFTGDLLFWHLAIRDTSIANATFLACLAPLWVALLSRVTIGEPVSRRTLLGLAICLPGTALLVFHSGGLGAGGLGVGALGDLYGILTSFFFGLYFLAVREARGRLGAGTITFRASVITAAGLLSAALLTEETLLPPSAAGAANLVALAWVSHAGGQGLLSVALGVLSASFSSLVIFAEGVFGASFGWLFAGEPVSLLQAAGGALIVLGLLAARPKRAERAQDAVPSPHLSPGTAEMDSTPARHPLNG